MVKLVGGEGRRSVFLFYRAEFFFSGTASQYGSPAPDIFARGSVAHDHSDLFVGDCLDEG